MAWVRITTPYVNGRWRCLTCHWTGDHAGVTSHVHHHTSIGTPNPRFGRYKTIVTTVMVYG